MNIIEEVIYYSWINKFLNRSDNLVSLYKNIKEWYIIKLDLNIRELWTGIWSNGKWKLNWE